MMNEENAIEVKNIKKSFKVYLDRSTSAKDFLIHASRRRNEVREVIKDISFDVKKGEALGIIGRNGCGKSTTLKLLTRIMYPDAGTVELKGRVTSLIELGAGFHPDMSGRENIYINASIFGLSKSEIDERIQDIIDYSELEGFIDNPVRTYSSGMYMRLAFAVAINVNADILLIDEILAVGDISFQNKCFKTIKEIKNKGTTIVLVSHDLGQIENICDTSIWIEKGLIKMKGSPREVHSYYIEAMGAGEWINDDTSPKELKQIIRHREAQSVLLKDELEKACIELEKTGKAGIIPDVATWARIKGEEVSDEKATEEFMKLNPEKNKTYLYYGCYGNRKIIRKLRMQGYKVYGFEPAEINIPEPYIICGRKNIEYMKFDGVFDTGYLEKSVDRASDEEFIKNLTDGNKKIEILSKLSITGENGGKREDGKVVIPTGLRTFGPYITLIDGEYKLHYSLSVNGGQDPKDSVITINKDVGEETLVSKTITEKTGTVEFATGGMTYKVEFLVEALGNEEVTVDSLVLEVP